MQTADVRKSFLEFFKQRGHTVVPSGPLIPPNDPTLMFANSGMVQFKDLFTGKEKRDYTRAASSQKCIRISGKHNDLEEVGPSPRHQTFFEMLGNFSFGDYFKAEAIEFAWDFLTKVLDLPKDRLVITYFKGEGGVPEDQEARELWKKIAGFSDERIIGLGAADNFWQVGDTGPCGPCSEIHFCNGPNLDVSSFGKPQTPEGYGFIEIWNLVFTQFDRRVDASGAGHLDKLAAPNIDTGAGLERLSSMVQGKLTNYDIDLLQGLVQTAASFAKKNYGASMSPDDVSMRVIADHARTTAFLIAGGVMPDRTGREYVLRRVMRRAIRHGHRLGIKEPFLHKVALEVVKTMGDAYPELTARKDMIASVAESEEVRFRQTIERGLVLLDERFADLAKTDKKTLAGEDAFKLYDTYGFPVDLTEVICKERGLAVDLAGYETALEEARKRSEFKGVEQSVEGAYREALEIVPNRKVEFTGYERNRDKAKIVALLQAGKLVERASGSERLEIVTERTPFYGEAGGQVGDSGTIYAEGVKFSVQHSDRPLPGLTVHQGSLESGELAVGQEVNLEIDVERREQTRRNHSATHLLHWALRKVLGPQAQQKGSLVGPDRLRFDFTHGRPVATEELEKIEDMVNSAILANHPVQTEILSMDEARKRGAMMIFEEKYGDVVRMLTMGFSVELCGGTHARATGDLGLFKVVSETGVAAGVRRILATTGYGSLGYLRDLEAGLARAATAARAGGGDLAEKIEKLVSHERALEKQVDELERKLAMGGGGGVDALLGKARDVGGIKVLALKTEVSDRGALRELAEQLRDKLGDSIVLVASVVEGKAQLVLVVAKPLLGRYKAGELIRPVAEIVGGSGGGRPDMAQAGGTGIGEIDRAMDKLYEVVQATAS